ncbi:endonuclease/exonuclease/phosphatase family protein [Thalassobellus suaedae]|uniref:Endonuclease/exonuclease/phosphatase family protein n=1 Tax=Thalassobellus suaedae TaxID=3074124 RepID=A0ABY9XS72_9FLAO|nr:endonuclease/exonuclease/phosphatase family protein [Flavobacteriaceae bacterium HL-DH14]
MVGSKRRIFKIILKLIKIVLQFINVTSIVALLTAHFVIKERTFLSSLIFYALPLPIIIVVVLFISIVLTKKWRRFNLILASILLLVWLSKSFKLHIPDDINKSDLEIVFWNASRANDFQMAFNKNEGVPDVMVLVESKKNDIEEFKRKYPNYCFYKSDRELFVFSKAPLIIESENKSKFSTTVINFKTFGINFYAVDVTGSFDVPREWGLNYVNKQINRKDNTIVLGDFNVPYESIYLKQFKKGFNHAFNEKGNGFRETWYNNIPLLSLDHIWVSKDLKVLKTEKFYTKESDHSMLKTYIRK